MFYGQHQNRQIEPRRSYAILVFEDHNLLHDHQYYLRQHSLIAKTFFMLIPY